MEITMSLRINDEAPNFTAKTTQGVINFHEILRVLDAMQLTAKHKVATPVNWNNGEDVIIVPAVSDEEAKRMFPEGWNTIKPYLRTVKQPS